ncbi:MAG: DUF2630 family protein [Actinobacteria bacterium]|nr:MAG: DUF2630 family protein [Actinomycetota bacterium]
MEDKGLLDQINELAAEEHELFQKESRGEATEADVERLRHLEVTLDQCWDLLHPRHPLVDDSIGARGAIKAARRPGGELGSFAVRASMMPTPCRQVRWSPGPPPPISLSRRRWMGSWARVTEAVGR